MDDPAGSQDGNGGAGDPAGSEPSAPVVTEIRVGDEPGAWRDIGFDVDDAGRCTIGTVVVRLGGDDNGGPGILHWTLAGIAPPGGGTLDGLPTRRATGPATDPAGTAVPPRHANGCTLIDHVVVTTPDLDGTTAALEAVGLVPRRTREAGTGADGVVRLQRFFRLGEVVLELVGPVEPTGTGRARFWGLAHEVADLDATAALLGDRLTCPRDAVQPGRRIASLRSGTGVSVPTAFITPDPARPRR
jgi:hypothetical protein